MNEERQEVEMTEETKAIADAAAEEAVAVEAEVQPVKTFDAVIVAVHLDGEHKKVGAFLRLVEPHDNARTANFSLPVDAIENPLKNLKPDDRVVVTFAAEQRTDCPVVASIRPAANDETGFRPFRRLLAAFGR